MGAGMGKGEKVAARGDVPEWTGSSGRERDALFFPPPLLAPFPLCLLSIPRERRHQTSP